MIAALWPSILERMVKEGEGFEKARWTFGVLLAQYGQAVYFAARNVGGVYISRSHKGDKDAQAPFAIVDPQKQREALTLLEEKVFSDKPFQFPPELLESSRRIQRSHWNSNAPRSDYPVHGTIALWQERILTQLLSPLTLERIYDSELKVAADKDAFTTAELIRRLTASIFNETEKMESGDYTERKPAVSKFGRNLQRIYLQRLSEIAMGNSSAPPDVQSVSFAELKSLKEKIDKTLAGSVKFDTYTKGALAGVKQPHCQSARRTAQSQRAVVNQHVQSSSQRPNLARYRIRIANDERPSEPLCHPDFVMISPFGRRNSFLIRCDSSLPSSSATKLDAVRQALNSISVTRMTVCDAQGYARTRADGNVPRARVQKSSSAAYLCWRLWSTTTLGANGGHDRRSRAHRAGRPDWRRQDFCLAVLETIQLFGEVRGPEAD